MRIDLCLFSSFIAFVATSQLASAAPVLWSTAPNSSGVYSLERIDVAAKTVTPVFPLGNNQVAFNGGLTFDSSAGLFNALLSESDGSATFVTFTKDGGGALTGLYKPGFGFNGGLAFASTFNDDYGIASAPDGSSTLLLVPTLTGTIRFAAALGAGSYGGLTFDPLNGEFYAISNDSAGRSNLVRIDLASGTVTSVGVSLGFGFTGGLAFDPSSNLLYAIGSDNSGLSTLFSFNTDASGIKAEFVLGFGFNDMWMRGIAARLDIVKGQAFAPDPGLRATLDRAARVAFGMSRAVDYGPGGVFTKLYQDRQWLNPFPGGSPWFTSPTFDQTDLRTAFFSVAYSTSPGMAVNMVDVGAKYPFAFTDANGNFLSGAKSYRLLLPKGIPAKLFWSVTVYDALTASGLDNGQPFPSINTMDKPVINADGSTDIYFGPTSPGDGKNWLRTVPEKGFFVILRLYGPTESFFNQTWRPGDIEKVE